MRQRMIKEGGVAKNLLSIVEGLYDQMSSGEIPNLILPTRSKNNIEYNEDSCVWVYGNSESTRSAKSVRGAYRLLKTVYTIDFLNYQLKGGKSSTLRELYYISEGWDLAKFGAQEESNKLIEDLEIMSDLQRENFHIRPEEDGASVIGPIKIREETRRGLKEIHCQDDVGEGGYQIPTDVDRIDLLEHDADFLIAIETGGMRDRLVENGFDEKYRAIIVHLKGQPARSTRRFLKRVDKEFKIPVVVFTDGDPWSYRIYASVAYGSIKSAHLSEYIATPNARFIGIQPSDIVNYDLPSDKLSDQDIGALKSELSDPRFNTDYWREEINLQLDIKKKSEQQALAKYGLDFVTDEYLPTRLSEMGVI